MALKQSPQALQAPDGSYYVTLTDGAGTLGGTVTSGIVFGNTSNTSDAAPTSGSNVPVIANSYAFNGTTWDRARSINSYPDTTSAGGALGTGVLSFNGSSYDRTRSNVDSAGLVTLSAAGASTVNGADQTNYNGRGAQIVVDITVATAMTLTINIQGKDAISGKYYTILSSAAFATVSTNQLTVYPGSAVTANVSIPMPLPRIWRIQAVVTGTSVTATVGASVIL